MIVQKYGGTSVGNAERLTNVANIVENSYNEELVLVVVSAMSSYVKSEGTTSRLLLAADNAIQQKEYQTILDGLRNFHLDTAKECIPKAEILKDTEVFINNIFDKLSQFLDALTVIRELSARSSDRILRVGEKLSAKILSSVIASKNLPAEFLDLSNIAPEKYTVATPQFYNELENRLKEILMQLVKDKKIPVITGFIGEIPGGIINSIGRGYTDYTSSMVASVLETRELQIWKEVDGIFTADQRLVQDAKVLPVITTEEAAELTYFGSEVIHPFTMERVTRANIPVRIKNTFNPELDGTLITDTEEDQHVIKNITAKKNISVLNVRSNRMLMAYGFMAKVFNVLEKYGIVIDLIATSEVSISMSFEKSGQIEQVIEELSEFSEVSIEKEKAIVSMVGQKMRQTVGISGKMFSCLSDHKINIEMISQGASEINISCIVRSDDADDAVKALHDRFIQSNS